MKRVILLSYICAAVLYAETVELDTITVTTKSEKSIEQAAATIDVITSKELKQKGITSIEEALRDIVGLTPTGMSSSKSINGRESISIRGMDSKHTMLLLDGKRLTTMDKYITNGNFQYKLIPIAMIKRIEILKGPISSLYGSSALGGVINIITKTPTKKFKGDFSLGGGAPTHDRGGEHIESSLALSGSVNEKLSFAYSGQYSDTKLTSDKDNSKLTEIEGQKSDNHFATLWYDIDDNNKIEFTTLQGNDKTKRVDFNTKKQINEDKSYDINKEHYNIGYKHFFDNGVLNLNAYQNKTNVYTNELDYTHKLNDKVLMAELQQEIFQNHFVVFGGEITKEGYEKVYDDATKTNFSDELTHHSLYLQDEVSLSKALMLTLGLRYDNHDKFGGHYSPKLYINYAINDQSSVKAGYGHGFNAPTLTESSDEYSSIIPVGPLKYIFKGNSNLKPEESDSFEMGYTYNRGNNIFIATLFHNDISNLIEPIQISTVGTTITSLYQNIGNAKTRGLELSYKHKNLLPSLDINSFFTYMNAEDSENNSLAFRPKYQGGLGVDYEMPLAINARFDMRYIGRQYNNDKIPKELGGYTTFDTQLSKTFVNNITLRAGIKNITNERLNIDYRHQLIGRYQYASLEYSF